MREHRKPVVLFFPSILLLLASCTHEPVAPTDVQNLVFGIAVTGISAIDLGNLTGEHSVATGVNDAGQIVGWSNVTDADGSTSAHAFFIDGTTVMEISGLGGSRTIAWDVNEVGQAVGRTLLPESRYGGFFWDGTVTDVGSLYGGHTVAWGLNNLVDVQVVGSTEVGKKEAHAFVWTATGGMVDIHDGSSSCSVAFDINDSGVVVGGTGNGDAFVWSVANGLEVLPALTPGGHAAAFGINEAGKVVGNSETASGDLHAVLWDEGVAIDLSTLPEHSNSVARAINEADQIVGVSGVSQIVSCEPRIIVPPESFRAFVWEKGTMMDLGSVNYRGNSEAYDINGSGGVVGMSGDLATLWTIETAPATPEEATSEIVAEVEGLVVDGAVSEGRGNALLSQLDAITRQLNAARTQVSIHLLEAFIKQVSDMISTGNISEEEGQALIQLAQNALDLLAG